MDKNDLPILETPVPPPVKIGLFRTALRLVALVILAILLHALFVWAQDWITQNNFGWAIPSVLAAALLIYAVLIAIPFVPGIEIGLMVLAVGGPDIAPLVWLATASGLVLAYMVGCKVPYRWLSRILLDLHLTRACVMFERFQALPLDERASFVQAQLPARYLGWVVKYRYVNLALLINIPGNSMIGGGGGIAFVSGLSGVFRAHLAILTLVIATAPVPLAIWLFGWTLS
ncbi:MULTISPECIES: hypothetical protein [unclassified Roseovarius]|jgi:hypothetical protein|uniref:hypothetical protein n=1 Tax=unclassified Roseovarius TaxID=2614913 RepID=UPI0000687DA8|nr:MULTISPECIES: hypothetical protein [unclassified Roseovarius]EAQ24223.1 hypothetical protein ROS217_11801 [Roseovarius sp. 217]KJS40666.1 MAG: hypothetical protein VR71_22000 [Roseovarius sp. BRH_c41]